MAKGKEEITPAVELEALSEEELVLRAQSELPYQLGAYKEILRRHEGLVFSTCMKMLGTMEDAEEVCQDAFLQVYHKLHQFEGRSTFKTWLFRIVYNFCLSRRAALAKRRERDDTVGREITEKAKEVREASMFEGASELVREALNELDEDARRLLVMRFVSGLSLAEIAEMQEIGLSAAKMRLYRTLDEFKAVYTKLQGRRGKEKEERS